MAIIERAALRGLIAEEERLAVGLLDTLAASNAQYIQRIATLATQGARGRLAAVLACLVQEGAGMRSRGSELTVELSAKDLGDMAGCSRQTASLWLGRMEKAGVITREGGPLRVVRPELL